MKCAKRCRAIRSRQSAWPHSSRPHRSCVNKLVSVGLRSDRVKRPLRKLFHLEAEDYPSLATKISPLMLVNTFKQREISNGSVRTGAVERLLECERDPLIQFIVERPHGHIAASTRTAWGRMDEVPRVGLVGTVHYVQRPTGVAPLGIATEPA